MEFIIGFVLGNAVALAAVYGYKFYAGSETKDTLIAKHLGKKFEEGIRLTDEK